MMVLLMAPAVSAIVVIVVVIAFSFLFIVTVSMPLVLPGLPVLLDLSVGHALVAGRNPSKIRRQTGQSMGNPISAQRPPWAVIAIGNVPVPSMRRVPGTLIAGNVSIRIRNGKA